MNQERMTIVIDGVDVEASAGQTIMEAAEAAGVYIPRLCYHPDLPSGGHCRVCTVKVNGRAVSACNYPVGDGLVIENETDELEAHRRRIVEMLFVEGNHYCPACEASGNCKLQATAYRVGMVAPELPYMNEPRELDATHPDIFLDRDRCILCGLCIRASKYADGKSVFAFENRGIHQRITVNAAHGLSETELNAADMAARICPTGCLRVKREGYKTPLGKRDYDGAPIGSDTEKQQPAITAVLTAERD